MNTRRSFISGMLKAAVACAVLPSAVTYARSWKKSGALIVPGSTIRQLFIEPPPANFYTLNTGLVFQWDLKYLENHLRIIDNSPLNLGAGCVMVDALQVRRSIQCGMEQPG